MARRPRRRKSRRAPPPLAPRRVRKARAPLLTLTRFGELKYTAAGRYISKTPPPTIARRKRLPLLTQIPDKRTYHPARRLRPVVTTDGRQPEGIKVGRRLHQLSFIKPKTLAVCVRRQCRREVMFAIGKGGTRGLGFRKRRRTDEDSKISCKR